uniref:Histone H3 n=1 Tax=Globodera pallida TaxID=36090 RepID=A0A183CU04_GLOPA
VCAVPTRSDCASSCCPRPSTMQALRVARQTKSPTWPSCFSPTRALPPRRRRRLRRLHRRRFCLRRCPSLLASFPPSSRWRTAVGSVAKCSSTRRPNSRHKLTRPANAAEAPASSCPSTSSRSRSSSSSKDGAAG